MVKKYLQLNALNAYKTAFNLSNFVWDVVIKWDYFAKNTVGEQFVTAMDSISANIAEGFGRYSKKDKVKFYRYSNGSLKECFDWNQKSNCENPQGLTELKPLQNLEGLTVRSMIIFSENFRNFQKNSINLYSSQIKN